MKDLKQFLVVCTLLLICGILGCKADNEILEDPNLPSNPTRYFSHERQKELSEIAETLLRLQDEPGIQGIDEKLKRHHLEIMYLDPDRSIVEFTFFPQRICHHYIYAQNGLPGSYSTKPIITEDNIMLWGELVSIIKAGKDSSKYSRDSSGFVTGIAYPFLVENLDRVIVEKLYDLPTIEDLDSFLSKHKNMEIMAAFEKRWSDYETIITRQLSEDEKQAVVEVLNKHCSIESRLVEHENIIWRRSSLGPDDNSLEFSGYFGLSSSFQVNKHLQRLISEGVISVKDRVGHLKVKSELSDKEKLEIEWLHIEIMRPVYGNLVRKRAYWSDGKTQLAERWYYYKE